MSLLYLIATISEDTSVGSKIVALNCTDADDDALQYDLVSGDNFEFVFFGGIVYLSTRV